MNRRLVILSIALVASAFLLTACGGGQDEEIPPLSKAERDSVLSESELPGSSAVAGALAVSDSVRARAERAAAAGK